MSDFMMHSPCPTCGQPISEHGDMLVKDFEIHITTPEVVPHLPEIDRQVKSIFGE